MSMDTSGPNVRKEDVLALADEKKKVEEELEALYGVLKSQGVGMDEPLVDGEGYPRNDVDVYQVRFCKLWFLRL